LLKDCRELTGSIFAGLDLTHEIRSVAQQQLGDTIFLHEGPRLVGFAVCHVGPGTEAGSGVCYIKFAAAVPRKAGPENLRRLLESVEVFARDANATKLTSGVNLARREAFQTIREFGFRTEMQGVAMESGEPSAGYNRAGVYILDDWR